jgi:hypothetical protein
MNTVFTEGLACGHPPVVSSPSIPSRAHAPHTLIRLEARETPNINDSMKTFKKLLQKIPEIQEVIT